MTKTISNASKKKTKGDYEQLLKMRGLGGNDKGSDGNKPKPSRGRYLLDLTSKLHAAASRANDANLLLHDCLDSISDPMTSATKMKAAVSTIRSIVTPLQTVFAGTFQDAAKELAPLPAMANAHKRSESKRSREIVNNDPSKKQALPKLMIQDFMNASTSISKATPTKKTRRGTKYKMKLPLMIVPP